MNSSVKHLWPALDSDRSDQAHRSSAEATKDQEPTDLKAALDDLSLSLEKANRRLNRILGERNQLEALLERRDEQIERLNRELGGHLSAHGSGGVEDHRPGIRGSLAVAFSSVVQATGIFFRKWREDDVDRATESDATDLETMRPSRQASCLGGETGRPVVAVVLFGLGRDEIDRLLPMIERDCASRGMMPLCLIDVDAFELLRERRLIFEYLPPAEERCRFGASLHWDLYIQRRLAIIRRKWDPCRIIAFGTSAMTTLSIWSSSPFEDEPLPAVLGSSTGDRPHE